VLAGNVTGLGLLLDRICMVLSKTCGGDVDGGMLLGRAHAVGILDESLES